MKQEVRGRATSSYLDRQAAGPGVIALPQMCVTLAGPEAAIAPRASQQARIISQLLAQRYNMHLDFFCEIVLSPPSDLHAQSFIDLCICLA
jgi:hypothetical protein